MIECPYLYEERLQPSDFERLARLTLRWSHTEHIIGNCLRVILGLTDEQATIMVFPLTVEYRLAKIQDLLNLAPMSDEVTNAYKEVAWAMRGLAAVRANVVHATIDEDLLGGSNHVFRVQSKNRAFLMDEIFSAEELTNYACHAALSLRFALKVSNNPDARHALPDRPAVPAALQAYFPTRKK